MKEAGWTDYINNGNGFYIEAEFQGPHLPDELTPEQRAITDALGKVAGGLLLDSANWPRTFVFIYELHKMGYEIVKK